MTAAQYYPVSEAHAREAEYPGRQSVEKASSHLHRMVFTPQHSAPDVLHLVHSRVGTVRDSYQPQAEGMCVSSSGRSGSSSECSVSSLRQVVGVCISPSCNNATTASQVGALNPVSNAAGCSPSALPVMASNAAQVASKFSSGETSITMTLKTASVNGIP